MSRKLEVTFSISEINGKKLDTEIYWHSLPKETYTMTKKYSNDQRKQTRNQIKESSQCSERMVSQRILLMADSWDV